MTSALSHQPTTYLSMNPPGVRSLIPGVIPACHLVRHRVSRLTHRIWYRHLGRLPWPWNMVTEAEVGITCFVNDQQGFEAILKHRVDDFLVNEVDASGTVVHLRSLEAAKEEDPVRSEVENAEEVVAEFENVAGKENAAKLKSFLDSCQVGKGSGPKVSGFTPTFVVLNDVDSKEKRTAIHLFFKKKHPSLPALTTDTVKEKVSKDGGKSEVQVTNLRIMLKNHASKISTWEKRGKHNEDSWEGGAKKYAHFTLYKENVDNNVALNTIGSMLKRGSKSFRIAGTKDKRGVTVQRVAGFKVPPSQLASLNSRLFKMKVGDFCLSTENLYIGQLLGNQFQIVLRGIKGADKEIVDAACDALRKTGFINYFGLQRFGIGTPTHVVGSMLLRGEWKGASELILRGCGKEASEDTEARKEFLEKWDLESLKKSLKNLSPGCVSESKLLEAYQRHGMDNHMTALMAIPRTMRTMYVHAYQSYLWNHAASLRFQKYGAENVVVGDLVLPPNPAERSPAQPSDNDEAVACTTSSYRLSLVRLVSQDDVDNGVYSIEDVVLPVPGSNTLYPSHDVGQEVYESLAAADDVSLTSSSHKLEDFSIEKMKGDYRKVFQHVRDLEHRVVWMDEFDEKMGETDLDLLRAAGAPGAEWPERRFKRKDTDDVVENQRDPKRQKFEDQEEHEEDAEMEGGDEGEPEAKGDQEKHLTLYMKFKLPSSSYATMLTRELMKRSSSKSEHAERSKAMLRVGVELGS